MTSGLTGPETDIIKQAPGLAHVEQPPLAASEMYVVVDLEQTIDRHAGQRAAARDRAGRP